MFATLCTLGTDCYSCYGSSQAGLVSNSDYFFYNYSKVTCLTIQPYDEKTKPAVTLFDLPNCMGHSGAFFGGGPGEEIGYVLGGSDTEIMRQTVSSVIVPANVILTLYDSTPSGKDFTGNTKTINGTGMNCINIPDFDNKTTTLKVLHKASSQNFAWAYRDYSLIKSTVRAKGVWR